MRYKGKLTATHIPATPNGHWSLNITELVVHDGAVKFDAEGIDEKGGFTLRGVELAPTDAGQYCKYVGRSSYQYAVGGQWQITIEMDLVEESDGRCHIIGLWLEDDEEYQFLLYGDLELGAAPDRLLTS